MKKLTENKKLKFWLDAEISWLHIMIAIVMFMLVENLFFHILLIFYMVWSFIYMLVRLAAIAASDPDFMKIPRGK